MTDAARRRRRTLSAELPDFPWDSLEGAKATAAAHPDGIINLSVGTPVDPVAPSIQLALSLNAGEPGYPQTIGTPELRAAVVAAMERRFGVPGVETAQVLPTVCLLYTSPSPRDRTRSRMPSSA